MNMHGGFALPLKGIEHATERIRTRKSPKMKIEEDILTWQEMALRSVLHAFTQNEDIIKQILIERYEKKGQW